MNAHYEVQDFNLGFELKNQNVLFQDSLKNVMSLLLNNCNQKKSLLLNHVESYAHISLVLKRVLEFLDEI